MESAVHNSRMEVKSQSRLGLPILVTFYLLVAMGGGVESLDSSSRIEDRVGGSRSQVVLDVSLGLAWESFGPCTCPWAWGLGFWWGGHWVLLQEGLDQATSSGNGFPTSQEDLAKLRSIFPSFDPESLGIPGVRSFRIPAPRAPSV
jgi:hypothetical protein